MPSSKDFARRLRASWSGTAEHEATNDYHLLEPVGAAYAARTKAGLPAIVVPLERVERFAIGRRAAGCELVPIKNASFRFQDHDWQSAGAALVCHENEALDAFQVLASDVVTRIGGEPTWASVVDIVQEWQTLLASKGKPNVEGELGLWGELWFISRASRVPPLIAGWRGPERDATDFFLDGVAAEVKTSRHPRRHHVSLTQVPAPVGAYPAWLLSLWVKEDPIRGVTVSDLVADLEARCDDPSDLLRRLVRAGFATASRNAYVTRYLVLDEPRWYAAADVPTIRLADPGVSEVRFRIELDEQRAADAESADRLWKHFLGQPYVGTNA